MMDWNNDVRFVLPGAISAQYFGTFSNLSTTPSLNLFLSRAINSLFLGGYEIKTSPMLEVRR